MKRIVTASAIIASVLVTAAWTGSASSAWADGTGNGDDSSVAVDAVSLPTAAAITSKTVTLTGTVQVGASADGLRSVSLWFSYPGDAAATKVGSATSRSTDLLPVTAKLDARRLVPGANQLQVIDAADGASQTVAVDLRRRSQVAITHAEARPHGKIALAVRVLHYDPKTNAYISSRLSPVRLQQKVGAGWVTLATVTSDKAGLAGAVLPVGRGAHYYRAFRPDGATVLAATSYTVRAGTGVTATTVSDDSPPVNA